LPGVDRRYSQRRAEYGVEGQSLERSPSVLAIESEGSMAAKLASTSSTSMKYGTFDNRPRCTAGAIWYW
jgi:hypothetical protein